MNLDDAKSALSHIDADDRDLWVKMCFAIKSEFGDAGFSVWDEWSRTSTRYKRQSAVSTWKQAKAGGRIGIGSLIFTARQCGWRGKTRVVSAAERKERHEKILRERQQEDRKSEWRRKKAAQNTDRLIQASRQEKHPYLKSKGFPDAIGLVVDKSLAAKVINPVEPPELNSDPLVIPLRDAKTNDISTCQLVFADGEKKFLPGGKFGGCVHAIGPRWGRDVWFCEGYATGMSVMAALREIHLSSVRVMCCFSAYNLIEVARGKRGRVIADHDKQSKTTGKRAGHEAAVAIGLPAWMPPHERTDANDYHLQFGLSALTKELREFYLRSKSKCRA